MSHNIITPDRPTTLGRAVRGLGVAATAYRAYQQARQVASYAEPYRQRVRDLVRRGNDMARSRRRKTPRRFKRSVRRFTGGRGITKEHDRTSIYRKKKMPRFKKRRWKRFSKKVLAVSEKDMGTQTVVFNTQLETGDFLNVQPLVTGSATLALYSMNGDSDYLQDLAVMMVDLHKGAPTVASGTTKYQSTKVIFKSGVLDLTLTNTSYDRIGGTNNVNSAYNLEVDVHTITIKKSTSDLQTFTLADASTLVAEKGLSTIDDMVLLAENNTKKVGGDDNKIFDTTLEKFRRGGTLWDTPQALSLFGIKIWNKRKYFLQGGQTMTYQMRDPKRRVMIPEFNMTGSNKPGWTKYLYITYKLVPGIGNVGSTNDSDIRTRIAVGITRKYSYKVEGVNDVRDNYNPAA